jgi:Lamin Tail Domain/FG-GAP repeat
MRYIAKFKYKLTGAALFTLAAVLFLSMYSQPSQAVSKTAARSAAAPEVSTSLVISQVYGGGGNAGAQFTNDYIEIFNKNDVAVDVTGWSVQYTSATGTTWQVTPICATGPCLVQPFKYFLVQEAAGAATPAPLPTPDAIGTIAMSATTGKVALVNTTVALTGACPAGAQIIDFVGYGTTANCFEGVGPAPLLSNTTADLRFNGGREETDNNSRDFFTAAPNPRNSASPANTSPSSVFRNRRADFDGDHKTDVSVWRPTDHNWYILQSNLGNSLRTVVDWGNGSLGDVAVPGDYDGDDKTDTAVFRESENNWYIIRSSDNTPTVVNWGAAGDVPVPGDYDGDGKTDVAVWRPSSGNWHIIGSLTGVQTRQWGNSTDLPVPNFDSDGDAKADQVVVRVSNGNAVWYIRPSNGVAPNTVTVAWGSSGDRLVPADYDGDGKTDIAVFRPNDTNWYIRNSTGSVTVRNWGGTEDIPVPGDYDGDNRYDVAVWRTDGNWYVLNSGNGTPFVSVLNLGVTADTKVPFAYLPPTPGATVP